MRNILTPLVLATALAVTACATGAPSEGSYVAQERRLAEECQARGGILSPSGQLTGRPETENVCKITGGATRIPTPR